MYSPNTTSIKIVQNEEKLCTGDYAQDDSWREVGVGVIYFIVMGQVVVAGLAVSGWGVFGRGWGGIFRCWSGPAVVGSCGRGVRPLVRVST